MYKILEWHPDIDLSRIYHYAQQKKIPNNCSKERMIDPVLRDGGKMWVVYHNDVLVATWGAHAFLDGYRVGARSLCIPHDSPIGANISLRMWATLQTVLMQFMIPKCLEWLGEDIPMYQTGHSEDYGKHKSMSRVIALVSERNRMLVSQGDIMYRSTKQHLWRFDVARFKEITLANKIWACENLNWPIKRMPGDPGIVSEYD